ncbi:MAG: helix-turn-helix domain-containing protein [Bacteroidales bacterium]|nr:helix-turn-helix domain-containing protein [Bacteroidales bacterium]MDD4671434.1 helix-turn-helix domain-containing protein [Bacteroidales bacterium]MDY0347531.1 helix-turn-helix domain-containing protein [Tenuifilaceae bacterium]
MELKGKVLETIKKAGKPMKAGEIAEQAGIDKKDVDKSIKSLVAEGVLESPKRCFYNLKG